MKEVERIKTPLQKKLREFKKCYNVLTFKTNTLQTRSYNGKRALI